MIVRIYRYVPLALFLSLLYTFATNADELSPELEALKGRTEHNFQLTQLLSAFAGACLETNVQADGFKSYVGDSLGLRMKTSTPYEYAAALRLADRTGIAMWYDLDYQKCCVTALRETQDLTFGIEETADYIEITFSPTDKRSTRSFNMETIYYRPGPGIGVVYTQQDMEHTLVNMCISTAINFDAVP